MTTDFDHLLTARLQAHADAGSPIDPLPLLHTATARGRQLRTRRRAVTAVVAMAAVAGMTAGTTLLPRQHTATPMGRGSSPSGLSDANLARLPKAVGQPGATGRPDLVGSDPAVLHFSVDALAAAAQRVTWSATPGVETAYVQRSDFKVTVALAGTRQRLPTAVSGGILMSPPAAIKVQGGDTILPTNPTLRLYSFVWQPVKGLWARVEVQTTSRDQAQRIRDQIRFDQARRCVLPIRLGYVPAGAAVADCTVELSANLPPVFWYGAVTLVDGQRRLRVLAAAEPPGGATGYRPHQVYADADGRTWTMLAQGLLITATSENRTSPFTQAEVRRILTGLRISHQLDNPDAW